MRAALLALACAALRCASAAPWQLRTGNFFVAQVPTGNAWGTSSYLLGDLQSHQAALIDCGGNASGAFALAAEHGLVVSALLLTHAHVDHVMGLAEARAAAPGARVHLHPGDASLYAAAGIPLPGALAGMAAKAVPALASLAAAAGAAKLKLPAVDAWLADGEELSVGAARLRVAHTPGHSAGHVTLYEPTLRVLFAGDLLLGASVGRADLPGCDVVALAASAARQCAALPPDARVLSGHAPPTNAAALRMVNPWCQQQQGGGAVQHSEL